MICRTLSPVNGVWPVTSRYSVAPREEVSERGVDLPALGLLGGDEVRRAEDALVVLVVFALVGPALPRGLAGVPGQAEVGDLHHALGVDHQVVGLDVAVDEAALL